MKTYIKQIPFLLFALFLFSCSKEDGSPVQEVEQSNENTESLNLSPESFTLLAVTDGAIGVDVRPTFRWNAALDPDEDILSYELLLDSNSNPITSIAIDINETTFTPQDRLPLSEKLYWKSIATDNNGGASSSNTFSFTTRDLNIPIDPVIENAPFSVTKGHTSVVFNNKMWVLGGYDGTSYSNDVWYSTDGINWTKVATPFSGRSEHTSVVFDGKIWVIGGYDGVSNLHDVWSSTDGINWIQVTSGPDFAKRRSHTSVVFDNKMWIINGFDGVSPLNDIWHSSNGVNWIQATSSLPFSGRFHHSSVVFNNKIWIISGQDGTTVVKDVWHSSDGVTWANASDLIRRSGNAAVVYDNKIWVIDGFDGVGGQVYHDVLYTNDGVTWSRVASIPDLQLKAGHTAIVYEDKIWTIGGNLKNDVRAMN